MSSEYPKLDQPVSNFNYPPLEEINQPSESYQIGQPLPPQNWNPYSNQPNPYSAIQQSNVQMIPVTYFPSPLVQPSYGQYDKQNMPPYPLNMRCPECSGMIITSIQYIPGCLTFGCCLGMCVMGLFCGCCLIPFCVDSCKKKVHKCPFCESVLGEVK